MTVAKQQPLSAELIDSLPSPRTPARKRLPHILRTRLSPGMGLLCNNVLHDRAAFTDTPEVEQRLLYRARYLDRITP